MACIPLLIVAGGLLAGCGDDPVPIRAKAPSQCLREAGLDRVGRHDLTSWRGYAANGTEVFVSKLTTKTDATMTRQETTDRWAFAVDRYLITGPAKDADGSVTAKVADCMKVGSTAAAPARIPIVTAAAAGSAAVRADTRFAGVALGPDSRGASVPKHRFFVADVYPLRLRDRTGHGARFSVCLTRGRATLDCQRGRTGSSTAPGGSSARVFVTAPGRPGRYVYRWRVESREVAAWRVDIRTVVASPTTPRDAPAPTAERNLAKARALAFARANDPALARDRQIEKICIRPSEADRFDCLVTYSTTNGDCFTVSVTVDNGVAERADGPGGRPERLASSCPD